MFTIVPETLLPDNFAYTVMAFTGETTNMGLNVKTHQVGDMETVVTQAFFLKMWQVFYWSSSVGVRCFQVAGCRLEITLSVIITTACLPVKHVMNYFV